MGRPRIGYNRIIKAQEVSDPDRAMFGCGPCGEMLYRQYKNKSCLEKNLFDKNVTDRPKDSLDEQKFVSKAVR
jgi:hypothetical protein